MGINNCTELEKDRPFSLYYWKYGNARTESGCMGFMYNAVKGLIPINANVWIANTTTKTDEKTCVYRDMIIPVQVCIS